MTGPAAAPDQPVDWALAASAGRRLAPPGPRAGASEVQALVAELRDAAERAVVPVAETSGLHAPEQAPPALVVDRAGWIAANAASMEAMLEPVLTQLTQRRAGERAVPRLGGTLAGTEVAGLLSWVSTKVLGQYDLAPQGEPRLLLVAPNVMQVERELELDASDFRLWVCLHEETHRLQFTAVPWLRDHLIDRARRLGTDLVPSPDQLGQRLQQVASRLPEVLRGETDLTQVLATPEQREQLAEVTAVMALLEGHADVVMDEVGPEVVPTVRAIRQRFERRRQGTGSVDKVLRRLLGMETKMRQYRDGARFVRAVRDEVGLDGFNAVWSAPERLPRPHEIAEPQAWVRRVHG
ncbi:zinc-dependent metalloprotease [Ornithinicoccus halotolerans]|uniref:zinc-dependent metalloprotease n=1 Tax=Ornithinicoccus halotolerans TaxID=1748220 RepID=UPI001296A203|nr:zinc-dependent metalloprotease [Ornithinicoccus halotolerans]